jgi:hypothetical protein
MYFYLFLSYFPSYFLFFSIFFSLSLLFVFCYISFVSILLRVIFTYFLFLSAEAAVGYTATTTTCLHARFAAAQNSFTSAAGFT